MASQGSCEIVVPGPPVTKGSLRAVRKGVVIADNAKTLRPYMEHIRVLVGQTDWKVTKHPVAVSCWFHVKRPESHYMKSGKLNPRYETVLPMKKKDDVDKLLRAVGDALTGLVYVDDCQVVTMFGAKQYADADPCAIIRWWELDS